MKKQKTTQQRQKLINHPTNLRLQHVLRHTTKNEKIKNSQNFCINRVSQNGVSSDKKIFKIKIKNSYSLSKKLI